MISWIIVLIFTGFILRAFFRDFGWDILRGGFLIPLFVSGMILLLCGMVSGMVNDIGWSETKREEVTVNIVSIEKSKTVEGTFFLGCGSVDGSMKYYWYEKTDKGYLLENTYASDCYIIESNEVGPHATYIKRWNEISEYVWIYDPLAFYHKVVNDIHKPINMDCGPRFSKQSITVPKGTILKEFRL